MQVTQLDTFYPIKNMPLNSNSVQQLQAKTSWEHGCENFRMLHICHETHHLLANFRRAQRAIFEIIVLKPLYI